MKFVETSLKWKINYIYWLHKGIIIASFDGQHLTTSCYIYQLQCDIMCPPRWDVAGFIWVPHMCSPFFSVPFCKRRARETVVPFCTVMSKQSIKRSERTSRKETRKGLFSNSPIGLFTCFSVRFARLHRMISSPVRLIFNESSYLNCKLSSHDLWLSSL